MKNKLTLFLLLFVFFGITTASVASGASKNFTFTPQVGIPDSNFQTDQKIPIGEERNGTTSSTLLADYIRSFYIYALNILGVLAVLILMAGGVQWIISGGNTKKIESAKKMISGSLFGSFLLLGSYFILNTINPDLTKLPVIEMRSIEGMVIERGCCDKTKNNKKAEITSSENCEKSDFHPGYGLNLEGQCEPYICCLEHQNAEAKTSGEPLRACSKKLKGDCSESHMTTSEKDCTEISSCQEAKYTDASCDGVADGEKANNSKLITNSWCYSGVLWTGEGAEGEPCGSGSNTFCKKTSICNAASTFSGRTCQNLLKCCKE